MSLSTLLGAIAFYTCIPIPQNWKLEFTGIARWAPIVGVGIGGLVALLDWGLYGLGMPVLTRSALATVAWLAITGGLHLDGAMDTADGLAVDPSRRLEVMADSRTGAFGVMAAGAILLLKTAALSNLESARWLALMAVAGWGRWGQLVAIACYPYLKAAGKGAFHKAAIRSLWEALPSFVLLLCFCSVSSYWVGRSDLTGLGIGLGGTAIAALTGAWFNRSLGGHTGDTYGAVVEWTEALFLCLLTILL